MATMRRFAMIPGTGGARSAAARIVWRTLAIALLALSLHGCLGVKFVYNRLDWLLPHFVSDFVTLTPTQEAHLDQEIARLRRWHCRTQLPAYIESLQAADRDIQTGHTDYATMAAHDADIQRHLRNLANEISDSLAELMILATDAQVAEILHNAEKENGKLRTEVDRRSMTNRRLRTARQMTEQLKRWIDNLTPAQEDAVAAWSEQMVGGELEHLEARLSWQHELRRLLEQREDSAAFRRAVRTLFVEPERFRPPAIAQRQALRREQTLQLLATIGGTLTISQRAAVARHTVTWVRDFRDLSCGDMAATTDPHASER